MTKKIAASAGGKAPRTRMSGPKRVLLALGIAGGLAAIPAAMAVGWALSAKPANDYDPIPDLHALILETQGFPPDTPFPFISLFIDPFQATLVDVLGKGIAVEPQYKGAACTTIDALEFLVLPYDPALDAVRTGAKPVGEFDFGSLNQYTEATLMDSPAACMEFILWYRQAVLDDGRIVQMLDDVRNGIEPLSPPIELFGGQVSTDSSALSTRRRLINLCMHEFRIALVSGNPDEAIAWFDRGMAMAQSLRSIPHPFILHESDAEMSILMQGVIHLLSHKCLAADELDRIVRCLDRCSDSEDEPVIASYREIEYRYWAASRFTESGIAVWREIAMDHWFGSSLPEKPPAITNLRGLIVPRRDATLAAFRDNDAALLRWHRLPVSDRDASPDHPDRSFARLNSAIRFPMVQETNLHVMQFQDNRRVISAVFRAAIAIERFHRRNGHYPASLAEFEPEFAHELPTNPLQPGEPLAYARLDGDGDRFPVRYLLAPRSRYKYSIFNPFGSPDDGSDGWLAKNAVNLPIGFRLWERQQEPSLDESTD